VKRTSNTSIMPLLKPPHSMWEEMVTRLFAGLNYRYFTSEAVYK